MTHNDCHLRPPFYCESVAKRRLHLIKGLLKFFCQIGQWCEVIAHLFPFCEKFI